MLPQAEKQEWYKNTIYYQERAAQEPSPGDLVRELHMQRTRLQSARSEIATQHSNERSPDHSAGDIKFGTKEMPDIGIGSTKMHPPSHLSLPESFFFDADEIELESGHNPGDVTSYRVFLNDFSRGLGSCITEFPLHMP